jgi:hypothetical protein
VITNESQGIILELLPASSHKEATQDVVIAESPP